MRGRTARLVDPGAAAVSLTVATDSLVHTALSYDSPEELAARVAPTIASWLSAEDRVHVNVGADCVRALEAALGSDARRVCWSDSRQWNPHPVRRLRAIQELVERARCGPTSPLRFVGEWAFPDGPTEMIAEWERFDAVLNEVLQHAAVTMVCAYDTRAVTDDLLDRVRCSHPYVGLESPEPSTSYVEPGEFLATWRPTLPDVPECARRVEGRVSPAAARAAVRAVFAAPECGNGDGGGATARRAPCALAEDMAFAATEIVTNAWQSGASHVGVACWRRDGEYALQVEDDGPGLDDVYAGYRRPLVSACSGRGLWIVRQLADLVEVAPRAPGTAVRVRFFEGGAGGAGGAGAPEPA